MNTDAGSQCFQWAVGVSRSRIGGLRPAARMVHKAIRQAFASAGNAPDPAAFAAPHGIDVRAPLAELHDRDAIRLDERGGIRVAYPFSAGSAPDPVHGPSGARRNRS